MSNNDYIKQLERDNEQLREQLNKKQFLEDVDKLIKHINNKRNITKITTEALQDLKAMHNIDVMKQIIELSLIHFFEEMNNKCIPQEFKADFYKELENLYFILKDHYGY